MTTTLTLFAILCLVWAAATDTQSRRIPNFVALGLVALALGRLATGHDLARPEIAPLWDLAAALLVFLAGAVAFHFGRLGGGDVKLLAAGTLWVGAASTPAFILWTAVSGGILAVAAVIGMIATPGGLSAEKRALGLPYGMAIAAGGIATTAGLV